MSEDFFFEKLKIYQRSLAFSISICRLADDFPIKYQRVRDQLIGAAISVPLNIAEGSGRKFPKEKINFCNISRSSLFECVPLLDICDNLRLIGSEDADKLKNEAVELSKMINAFISSIN